MTGKVTGLWRHPIKSHGREALESVTLSPGQTMPGDRVWAVAHEKSRADNSAWAPCQNFTLVSKVPALMAMSARLRGEDVTLRHPDRPDLTFAPDREEALFLDWVKPLMPENRAQSTRIVRVPGRGMTDSDFPSVTVCNMASHRAVEQKMGRDLSPLRWRSNIWFDGLPLWEEFDWIGREVQVGEVVFAVRERTERCMSVNTNPETGIRDAETLGTLDTWGHRDFSVRAEVIQGGDIRIGDEVRAL